MIWCLPAKNGNTNEKKYNIIICEHTLHVFCLVIMDKSGQVVKNMLHTIFGSELS